MKNVARFEKVSLKQFASDTLNALNASEQLKDSVMELITEAKAPEPNQAHLSLYHLILKAYKNIQLPKRSTVGSAGYDFHLPFEISLFPDQVKVIPTGIRCNIDEGYSLDIYPRSGLGFKYRLRICNTVAIIDQDFYNSDSEGHILIKVSNETFNEATVELKAGDRFCQGIFHEYFITYDDEVTKERNGGIGSTGN